MTRDRERWTGRKAADLDAGALNQAKASGYERGPNGYMTGRDPRRMSPDEVETMGHQRMSAQEAPQRGGWPNPSNAGTNHLVIGDRFVMSSFRL